MSETRTQQEFTAAEVERSAEYCRMNGDWSLADMLRAYARLLSQSPAPAGDVESMDSIRRDIRTYAEGFKEGWITKRDEPSIAAPTGAEGRKEPFDFAAHLQRQREFSERTFGPGARTQGVVDHIRKELTEILAKPDDLSEWADVVILGLDGFWRAGASPEQIIAALVAKQTKNEGRKWPDWRTAPAGKAIEHDRSADAALTPSVSVDRKERT